MVVMMMVVTHDRSPLTLSAKINQYPQFYYQNHDYPLDHICMCVTKKYVLLVYHVAVLHTYYAWYFKNTRCLFGFEEWEFGEEWIERNIGRSLLPLEYFFVNWRYFSCLDLSWICRFKRFWGLERESWGCCSGEGPLIITNKWGHSRTKFKAL